MQLPCCSAVRVCTQGRESVLIHHQFKWLSRYRSGTEKRRKRDVTEGTLNEKPDRYKSDYRYGREIGDPGIDPTMQVTLTGDSGAMQRC